jgi:hypothetical protein
MNVLHHISTVLCLSAAETVRRPGVTTSSITRVAQWLLVPEILRQDTSLSMPDFIRERSGKPPKSVAKDDGAS